MKIVLTDDGFVSGGDTYWRLEVAAAKVGIHPQSLQRIWRNSGFDDSDRTGLKLGRTLFFHADDLSSLGYPIRKEKERENVLQG